MDVVLGLVGVQLRSVLPKGDWNVNSVSKNNADLAIPSSMTEFTRGGRSCGIVRKCPSRTEKGLPSVHPPSSKALVLKERPFMS